ncbi:reticulate body protein Rbp-7, partial [Chlamydia suis]
MQHTIMLSLENDNEELASIMNRVVTASSSILSASKCSESDKQFNISKA